MKGENNANVGGGIIIAKEAIMSGIDRIV